MVQSLTFQLFLMVIQNVPGQISITFDAWTSKSYDPYLAITAHYIDAPSDKPNEWELKARTLAFTNIEGDHGGANLANMIIRVVQKYGLVGKVGWATSDNASVNDKAMRVLQGIFHATPEGQKWLAKERCIRQVVFHTIIKRPLTESGSSRCMEHSLHLGAKAFLEDICPNPTHFKSSKMISVDDVEVDEMDDSDWVDSPLTKNTSEEVDIVENIEPGDLLGKVLALITQVSLELLLAIFNLLLDSTFTSSKDLLCYCMQRGGTETS